MSDSSGVHPGVLVLIPVSVAIQTTSTTSKVILRTPINSETVAFGVCWSGAASWPVSKRPSSEPDSMISVGIVNC